ncbi:hypothetical protein HL653_06790 [Sphingomonas sp. AP4-R1]|uniref:hypothetical protein n=1 Tax=Sphingomonas sp. AP4-R1 TaxID=2735134 RepID=UPI00149398C0|nr:hypothetical protein [Sphingomonas sp. AP4-R1]QJU57535.1 hypothetical protein HL653_06790 [Sphingomonas sp. AP4-R1]
MRLFGKRAEASARPALVRAPQGILGGGLVAGAWPRSYEAQVAEAYLGNAIAQRAVRIVAEGAAGVPVYAATGPERGAGLIAPVLVETIAAQLLLHGGG